MKRLRLAVNTGGGDAPGLNAVVRAITLAALNRGYEVFGIRKGYLGLLDTSQLVPLTFDSVRGITHLGGSILGTNNRGNPLGIRVVENGQERYVDVSDQAVENFRRLGFDGIIAIGGDGSLRIAVGLMQKGIPIIGVPKTIDNDLAATAMTFGFDTAVATATDAIDKLHSTAESHERVMVVEVMGRYCGWIALSAGMAGSADAILIPEIPFRIEKVCEKIMAREAAGRHFSIVVCAEGAMPVGGEMTVVEKGQPGKEARLGGIAEKLAREIELRTGKESRSLVLGHLQRGGTPTSFDRMLSLRFGAAAVRLAEEGRWGSMVAYDPPEMTAVPLGEAVASLKTVPVEGDTLRTARELGISFGD
jgi:ATP-dependent phosphofructokinase / diphosphate-dependent phosphofructokinase